MLSVQPIFLPKVSNKSAPQPFPNNATSLFYLSWEDALWDILEKKKVPFGSTVLVPTFFCGDVEGNIKDHGYNIAWYSVSADLQTPVKVFKSALTKYQPQVVVILHAVGITNSLFEQSTSWLPDFSPETILIEDCVHRIVEPRQVRFLHTNHFLLSSLRKVVPLQGSVLYGSKQSLIWKAPSIWQSLPYAIEATALWLIMLILWKLSHFFSSTPKLSICFARSAEWSMLQGYHLIGDAKKPAAGWKPFFAAYMKTNFEAIKKVKTAQVLYYEKAFPLVQPLYPSSDRGELRGWPLLLPKHRAEKIVSDIRSSGLLLRLELNESKWSDNQKIIYLPLGTHITHIQQQQISLIVKKQYTSYLKKVLSG